MCPTAAWDPNGITFANATTIGNYSRDLFITTNDRIYSFNQENQTILIWFNGSMKSIEINITKLRSIFVTNKDEILIGNRETNGTVHKCVFNSKRCVPVMNINSSCYDLFVDINDILYCSQDKLHQVVKKSLTGTEPTPTTAAGTGTNGASSKELNRPLGIFVHENLDLYVADCRNNRVQLFQSKQRNGMTVVGHGSVIPTVRLSCPTGIVLDLNKYIFIADGGNNRIVGSGPNGFRCIIGCTGESSQPYQLSQPRALSFDSHGNIFVTDRKNKRIQKFNFISRSCGK